MKKASREKFAFKKKTHSKEKNRELFSKQHASIFLIAKPALVFSTFDRNQNTLKTPLKLFNHRAAVIKTVINKNRATTTRVGQIARSRVAL